MSDHDLSAAGVPGHESVVSAPATPALIGTLHLPKKPLPKSAARPRRAITPVGGQLVITKKSVLMQRLADLVRTGHTKFVQGVLVAEKAAALAAKLDAIYQMTVSQRQQSRRRERGDASARLVMWSPSIEDRAPVHWVLLITAGHLPPEASREAWRDALSKTSRLEIDGYELVRLTKPEEPRPVWTWRYTAAREQAWRESVIQAIRTRRDADLRQHIHNLWRSPGFAGIRVQVKKIGVLMRSEWRRSRLPNEVMPEIPARIGYVRRLPDVGVPIADLMSRRRGNRAVGTGRRAGSGDSTE